MTDFDKVRAILDAATPGPWYRWHGDDDHCMNAYAVTSEPCDHEFTSDDGHPSHVIALTLLQQPRLASLGHEPREVTLTDRNVDAMRWDENARAIVVARNLAPELLAVAEAAERIDKTWNAYVEAQGGRGHIGQEHTRESRLEGGCGLCESARYGTEVEMDEYAAPDLRAALDALHAKMKETL